MRRMTAGEMPAHRGGTQAREFLLGRVHIGQVTTVNTKAGTMKVALRGTQLDVTVPIPTTLHMGRATSAWQRYMPTELDFVLIAFDAVDQAVVVGNYVWGASELASSADAIPQYIGGYAAAADAKAAGVAGFREFVELKRGEWDMRSSGGAYMHGSAGGVLSLYAGTTAWRLRKSDNEIQGEGGLVRTVSDSSVLRFGDVKRKLLPTDFSETKIVGSNKEYSVHVSQALPGGAELPVYDFVAGDVRDGLGLPVPAAPIGPAVVKETVSAGVTAVYTRSVDAAGNTDTHSALINTVSSDLPAGGVKLGSSTGAVHSVAYGVELVAVVQQLAIAVQTLAAGANPLYVPGAAAALGQVGSALTALGGAPNTLYSLKVLTE